MRRLLASVAKTSYPMIAPKLLFQLPAVRFGCALRADCHTGRYGKKHHGEFHKSSPTILTYSHGRRLHQIAAGNVAISEQEAARSPFLGS